MTPKGIADVMAEARLEVSSLVASAQAAGDSDARPPRLFRLGYQVDGLHSSVRDAHRAVQWMLSDIITRQTSPRWVSLLGVSGCGKTHLAMAAKDALRGAGFRPHEAQFWSWRKAKALVTSDHGGMAWLHGLEFLALDDVGTGYSSSDKAQDFQADLLLELLEGRRDKWTLITSNLLRFDIASRLDPRIASRLYRGSNVVVDMSGAGDFYLDSGKKADFHPRGRGGNPSISHSLPPCAAFCAPRVDLPTPEEQATLLGEIKALVEDPRFQD